MNDFNLAQFHFNYGAGLRFKISEYFDANIRLDYGRTKDSHGFCIVFGEAFYYEKLLFKKRIHNSVEFVEP